MKRILALIFIATYALGSANQTPDCSPIIVNGTLPFTINIQTADFKLPHGIQSGAFAQLGFEVLFIAGRTNGLHGFSNGDNNFPPRQQNSTVYVVNLQTKQVASRSLRDCSSGLTQQQIDTLSVTSPESYQRGNILYMAGGYGVDTATGNFSTKDTLTAIDVPGLISWVKTCDCCSFASQYIRQISHPIFQVTGGEMRQVGNGPTLLIFGQNFTGFYNDSANGAYTQQVRRFRIIDNGHYLGVAVETPTPQNPNYRRRDLNVVSMITFDQSQNKVPGFVALSGVFTLDTGIWTVPVEITADGQPTMADPNLPTTFKQCMNNYNSATASLLSDTQDMYFILFGGITFGYYQNGVFETDTEIPFTNQVTVVKRSASGLYEQYLLPSQYPTILSHGPHKGNPLLFGAGAKFIFAPGITMSGNGVINLAAITTPTIIGYIIGGIQSTLPNTNTQRDSAASPYIFEVILSPA